MNKLSLPFLIFTILICGCNNPFESKDKGVQQLNSIEKHWEDTYTLTSLTARVALSTPVSNLQKIRRELENIEVSECLNPAKKVLSDYMDIQINNFLIFMADETFTEFKPTSKLKEYFSIKETCTGKKNDPESRLVTEAEAMDEAVKAEQVETEKAAKEQAEDEAKIIKEAKETGLSVEEATAIHATKKAKEAEEKADALREAYNIGKATEDEVTEAEINSAIAMAEAQALIEEAKAAKQP